MLSLDHSGGLVPFEHIIKHLTITAAEIVETKLDTNRLFTSKDPAKLTVPGNGLIGKPGTF